MKHIGNVEIKKIELEILKYIKGVCTEHGLTYFLAGGTLLGAVRHKGFIPWDDDIDIAMPRAHYEQFLNIVRNDSRYTLIDASMEECFYQFAKVCDARTELFEYNSPVIPGMGVYVDVFPLDNFPNPGEATKKYMGELKVAWRKVFRCYPDRRNLMSGDVKKTVKAIGKYIYRLFHNREKNKRELYALMTKYNGEPCGYWGIGLTQYGDRTIYKKDDKGTILAEFEGEMFSIPVEWDMYLRTQYGEYMTLPPEEKRVPHHSFDAFWKTQV